MLEKLYSTGEAARTFGVKTQTVREWIKKGKINAVMLPGGKGWRVPESEIRRVAYKPYFKSTSEGSGQE